MAVTVSADVVSPLHDCGQIGRGLTRRVALLKAVLASGGALVGATACAQRSPSVHEPATPTAGPPATVSFLHVYAEGTTQGDSMKRLLARFHTSQNRVTVESIVVESQAIEQKRLVLIAGGTPPDISYDKTVTSLPYVERGQLIAVADQASGQPTLGLNSEMWLPGIRDYVRYKGKQWVLPFESNSMVFAYNQTLLDRANVPPPALGWTWDDFVDAARRLTSPDAGIWGYANDNASWIFRNWIVSSGGTWYQQQGDKITSLINSADVVDALQRWTDLWLRHRVTSTEQPANAAQTGRAAIWSTAVGIPWMKTWGIPFGQTTIPKLRRGASYWADKVLFLHKTTEDRQAAAWRFMRWLVSDEQYIDWMTETGYLPLTKTQATHPRWQKLLQETPQYQAHLWPLDKGELFGVPIEPAAVNGKLDAPIGQAIQKVFKGEASPKVALDEAKAVIDDLLTQGVRY